RTVDQDLPRASGSEALRAARQEVKIALRVLAGAALLALVIWYVDPRSLVRSLAGVDPWLFSAAVGVAILSNVVSALRWSAIAHRLGLASSTRNTLLMYARAITANMMLP